LIVCNTGVDAPSSQGDADVRRLMSATTACVCIAATYVAPLYLWADGPRNEPRTILRRMGATLACCCMTWIPAWLMMPQVLLPASAESAERSQSYARNPVSILA
jgi:hypothetical protein